jgi:hypothetical protein
LTFYFSGKTFWTAPVAQNARAPVFLLQNLPISPRVFLTDPEKSISSPAEVTFSVENITFSAREKVISAREKVFSAQK